MRIKRGRKDNKTEIRQRIIKAATDAFCEKGIKSVKMDDIASSISVSKRTIYEIFHDKEQLLLEIVKEHEEETSKYIEDKGKESDNVLEVFFAVFERVSAEIERTNILFFYDLKKYPSVINFLNDRKEITADVVEHGFMCGIKQGLFREDVNFNIIRMLIIDEMQMIMKSSLTKRFSPVELHESIYFMHLRGIATYEGLKKIDDFMEKTKRRRERKENFSKIQ